MHSVEPSAYGKEKGFTTRSVAADASLEVLLQVRRFRVGEKDGTGAHQVLDGPYIAQQGSDTAVISLALALPSCITSRASGSENMQAPR